MACIFDFEAFNIITFIKIKIYDYDYVVEEICNGLYALDICNFGCDKVLYIVDIKDIDFHSENLLKKVLKGIVSEATVVKV